MKEVNGNLLESTGNFLVLQISKEEFEKQKEALKDLEVYFLTDMVKTKEVVGTNGVKKYFKETRGYIVDGSEQVLFKTTLGKEEYSGED